MYRSNNFSVASKYNPMGYTTRARSVADLGYTNIRTAADTYGSGNTMGVTYVERPTYY